MRYQRCLRFAVPVTVLLSVSVTVTPALADPTATTSLVEDGAYPFASEILQTQNVRLLNGDGHIVLANCATPPVGDIGLLKVYSTDETVGAEGIGRVCFRITAGTGRLDLQIPGVYEIRGDGQVAGAGHQVTAKLTTSAGQQIVVDVDPDGSTPVGEGADPTNPPTALLQLRTGGALAPVTGARPAVGKVMSDHRICTAALVAPQWILTATNCFADNPDQPSVPAGPPSRPAEVVFPNRPPVSVARLVPRADRNLVLAKLLTPVAGVGALATATSPPAVGAGVQAVGYGRTATTWGNDSQHEVALEVTGSDTTSLLGTGQLCKGDAGAPVFGGGSQIVAVASRAGQAGCLDGAGAGSMAVQARVDDISLWLKRTITDPFQYYNALSDRCFAIEGTSTPAAGQHVVVAGCAGTGRMRFEVLDDGQLRNPESGLCLNIEGAEPYEKGRHIVVSPCTGAAGMRFESRPDGQIRNPASGWCLNIYGEGPYEDGRHLIAWGCNATDNMKFRQVADEQYFNPLSGYCLNIFGGAPYQNGQHLVAWGCNGTDNMRFYQLGDGKIRNPASGKCVGVEGAQPFTGGRQVVLADCGAVNALPFQRLGDGQICGVSLDLCLNIYGEGPYEKGRKIIVWPRRGTGNMIWASMNVVR